LAREKKEQQRKRRRSIRLKGYDYSGAGAYFVMIVTQDRLCLFGEVLGGEIRLNDAGRMAEQCWYDIPIHFPNIVLDEFIVMPNHVHGVVTITNSVGAKDYSPLPLTIQPPPIGTSKTVGSVVRGFKVGVTKWFRNNSETYTVWQRNYHEHIIRNEKSLNRIREYILDNPLRWDMDRENPLNVMLEGYCS